MNTKTVKTTLVLAKILEVFCAVILLAYIALFILIFASPNVAAKFLEFLAAQNNGELSVQGFDIVAIQDGVLIRGAAIAFAVAGVLSFACRAMIFRNVHLILKTAAGKTRFSKGETPFQKDTVRMVFEIGIFYVLIPVLQFFVSLVCRAALAGSIETSVRVEGIITGLVIIALSQIFGYGEKLENEIEGLV